MATFAVCGLVAAVASPLLECGKLVFCPIYRTTTNFFNLQSNLRALQQKMITLIELQNNMSEELEAADKFGNFPTPQAKEWLAEVGEILIAADQMVRVLTVTNNRRLCRFRLSTKVCKTLKEVERLVGVAYPIQRVAPNHQTRTIEYIPGPSIEDNSTASRNLAQVMDLLSLDEVRRVGIWGMGGVGKTTIVKNLNNKIASDGYGQHFGLVIWVIVSKDFNLKRVQTQIADRLSLMVGESNEYRMAIRLHERLQREKKFLLILDDLWQPIDLDRVGIPKPEVHLGGKILLTSRSLRICSQMKTDKQVQVKVLDEREGWKLFSGTVGRVANLEEIEPIAKEVCKQFSGLPLAIVIVGAAMRDKDMIQLWDDALNELRRSIPSIENVEEEVFKPLKWSYDKLQGNNIKPCFLYCCLYPEDYEIKISELVKCWVGEGFIDVDLNNYEVSLNRGLAIVQNLKEACLLEIGKESKRVKMHDVVRDVAIWISSTLEVGCKFLVRAGTGLTQVSEVELTEDLKRISFMKNNIDMLSCDTNLIECSNASTLFLQGNPFQEIPEGFLPRFRAVRVLNLSDTGIASLPPCIMQLADLRTLLLGNCKNLKELPPLGWEGIQRIQILDLSLTCITKLPSGMKNLSKLRELHLYGTRRLKGIPAGLFFMLSSLELLNMDVSRYEWGCKGKVEDKEANLEELENLSRLRELCIKLKPKTTLCWTVNSTWINRLAILQLFIGVEQYRASFGEKEVIICGHSLCWTVNSTWINRFAILQLFIGVEQYRASFGEKEVIICGHSSEEQERVEYLLSSTNATSLRLHDCGALDQMLQNMAFNTSTSFSALKLLTIWGSDWCFSPGGGGCGAQYDLLPNLEQLYLRNLSGMKSISELVTLLGLKFSKVRSLVVRNCEAMKYLLSDGHHLILENLQQIKVWDSKELEEVFQYVPTAAAAAADSVGIVPNLRVIGLQSLPKLRTICKSDETETLPSLEELKVEDCRELRKIPLCFSSKNIAAAANNSIKLITGEESWWNNLQWDDLHTKDSLHHLFKPFKPIW